MNCFVELFIIISYKDANKTKIKISIFITGIEKTDQEFRNNKIIDIVRIDSSVKEIKSNGFNGSFEGCSSLTQITIPSSVTSIGESAFRGCSSLTQITFTIPSSVTSIGEFAFSYCPSLTQITILSSVTSIGNSAFIFCRSLAQITISSSLNSNNLGINFSATKNLT